MMNFAFYGSLRSKHYNHDRLVAPATGVVFVDTKTVLGYKLYDTGWGFPFAVKTGNTEDSIVVELFQMPESMYTDSIKRMEIGAGYREEIIRVKGANYTIYVRPEKATYKEAEVPGGDWTAYKTDKILT